MDYKVNIVGVVFDNNGGRLSKVYSFFNVLQDLKVGDKVVCDTRAGLSIGEVVKLDCPANDNVNRFIVDIIDFKTFNDVQERIQKREEIQRKLEEKLEKYTELAKYKLLAETDEEAAKLLEELSNLELN